MKLEALDERAVADIGHAFGYYDYGAERGLIDAFPSRDAAAAFICGYVRMALRAGMLYATSANGEGYAAYKLPGQRVRLRAALPLVKGLLGSMRLKELICFARIMAKSGPGLRKRLGKAKKPYIYVGLVCVREPYQGQGYMRKVTDMAFAEGRRLGVPVILDTDAKSKCDKYVHLGMELAGTRRFGEHGVLYDLIKYPDAEHTGDAAGHDEAAAEHAGAAADHARATVNRAGNTTDRAGNAADYAGNTAGHAGTAQNSDPAN